MPLQVEGDVGKPGTVSIEAQRTSGAATVVGGLVVMCFRIRILGRTSPCLIGTSIETYVIERRTMIVGVPDA